MTRGRGQHAEQTPITFTSLLLKRICFDFCDTIYGANLSFGPDLAFTRYFTAFRTAPDRLGSYGYRDLLADPKGPDLLAIGPDPIGLV